MHNNYIVRKSFHTLIAGSILEVHCRSSQKEKVINIHDISGRTVDELKQVVLVAIHTA